MPRFLHGMIRIGDPVLSVKFYEQVLGLKLLRKISEPEDGFDLYFLGYGGELNNTVLELTHNYDTKSYDYTQRGFGHFAFAVDDVVAYTKKVEAFRAEHNLTGSACEVQFVTDDAYMSFVTGPSSETIELLNEAKFDNQVREHYARHAAQLAEKQAAEKKQEESA